MLVDSRIIKSDENGYYFYERTYFAYFAAREIRRKYIEEGDYSQFNYAMEYAYTGLNADILLFVTYISDNLNMIRMIMNRAEQSVSKWEEFSLEPIGIPYLNSPAREIIKPVEEGDREKEEQQHIEAEKAETQAIALSNDSSIFDGESEEISFIQEMIRAISIMTLISRILPSFEHLMHKSEKDKCVDLIYTMPLRIFNVWAKEVDSVIPELVYEIKAFQEWEYRKDRLDLEPVSDDDALRYLRWESMSLLLELMHVAIVNSTRDNTWEFLDKYNYHSAQTFGIEHLMSLGKRNSVDKFITEAERLFKDIKPSVGKEMVQRVAHNFIVTSRDIKYNEISRLNAKLFSDQLKTSRLLIEQEKNKPKQ